MTTPPTPRRAFTLIELLVVVAIITALIAILLPSLGSAVRLATQTSCGSNMRQMGVAMNSYFVDNERSFPGPTWYGQYARYNTSVYELSRYLAIYLGQPRPTSQWQTNEVFIDPAWEAVAPSGVPPEQGIIYGASGVDKETGLRYMGYPPNTLGVANYDPLKMTTMDSASDTWALRDIDVISSSTAGWASLLGTTPQHGYHNGQVNRNYLFYDGHVEPKKDAGFLP